SRNRLAAIVTHAAEGIVTMDEHGQVESFNQAAEQMFGYTASAVIGQNLSLLIPRLARPESAGPDLPTGMTQLLGHRQEVSGRHKDGTSVPLELAVSSSKEGARPLFIAIMRDLTGYKALEKEVLDIATAEQRRIGQDLHDSTGQELTGL